eukprot:scaffold1535_cov382-Prasinococcus_capsulatus_cf.AAC.43
MRLGQPSKPKHCTPTSKTISSLLLGRLVREHSACAARRRPRASPEGEALPVTDLIATRSASAVPRSLVARR